MGALDPDIEGGLEECFFLEVRVMNNPSAVLTGLHNVSLHLWVADLPCFRVHSEEGSRWFELMIRKQ